MARGTFGPMTDEWLAENASAFTVPASVAARCHPARKLKAHQERLPARSLDQLAAERPDVIILPKP